MTISVNSTQFFDFAGSDPAAQDATVVSGCAAVANFTGYAGGGWSVSSVTLDGLAPDSFIQVVGDASSTGHYKAVWLNPASGTRALNPAFNLAPAEGCICALAYIAHSAALSVVDLDCDTNGDEAVTASATSSSNTGDFALACAQGYGGAPTIGGTGATNVSSGSHNFNGEFVQLFTVTAGASTSTATSAGDYPSVGLVILRESGGATTSRKGGGAARKQMTRGPHLRMARKDRIYVPAYLAAGREESNADARDQEGLHRTRAARPRLRTVRLHEQGR